MVLPRNKKLIAVAIGIILGGVPAILFNYWLIRLVERQNLDEVETSASRAVGIIEGRLTPAIASLDDLARRGAVSCAPHHLDELRRAGFLTFFVKEFSIIGADGTTQCSSLDAPAGDRTIVTSDRVADADGVFLDIVRIAGISPLFVRLRRVLGDGSSLAALGPADLLLPLTAGRGGPFGAWARLQARDGTFVAEGGTLVPETARGAGVLTAQAQSTRFGISVLTEMARDRKDQHADNLWAVGWVVNAVFAGAMVMAGWLLMRRAASHPLADIERALASNEFIAYYQPIVDITSAKLLGAEVLVRWRKPDGTIISPAAFVPLLEQGGLIMDMTRQLMRGVCAEIGTSYAARPHLTISFNLTAAHFADDRVVSDVRAIFEPSPVRLSQVVLELTERQPLRNLTSTRRVIAALQGLGCIIALDDFGTGHSGLSSILRLGVDIIKIDKIFIDSISSERNSGTIIDTLVDLARNMRMRVVAEGVENFEQVADLRARGIRAAQGYLFAPPLPGSAFLSLLEALDPVSAGAAGDPSSPRLAAE